MEHMIPIFGIIGVFGGGVAIVYIIMQMILKSRRMSHEERLLSIEKGVPIPQSPPKIRNPYSWPLVLIGIGLAFIIGALIEGDYDWGFGFIPLFIGTAMLVAHSFYKKKSDNLESDFNENIHAIPAALQPSDTKIPPVEIGSQDSQNVDKDKSADEDEKEKLS